MELLYDNLTPQNIIHNNGARPSLYSLWRYSMKKRIAVFANGWNSENMYHFMTGLSEAIPKDRADLFVFLSHAAYGMSEAYKKSEGHIYDLPNLSEFDGAVIMGPGLNFPDAIQHICDICSDAKIPVVSMGIRHPGFKYIKVDNYVGMRQLCSHILDHHKAKKILFIAGSQENEDSNVRLKAIIDSMKERNLPFDEENDVFYSNWEPYYAQAEVIRRYGELKMPLPDAILCANDQLSIIISLTIEQLGLNVPDDIIITGFDFNAESQMFYPAIASVNQYFDKVGGIAGTLLFDCFSGKEVPDETIISSEFEPGESCGCMKSRDADSLRRTFTRHIPLRNRAQSLRETRLITTEWAILGSEFYSEVPEKLQQIFAGDNLVEGDTFAILLDPRFAAHASKDIADLPKFEFNEIMDVILAKYDGKLIEISKFPIYNLIPGYDSEGKSHCFVFTPLYIESFIYGYIVMCDNLQYFDDMVYRHFNDRIRRIFDSYRKNLKLNALNAQLSELMQRDALTSARNRIAYENYKTSLCERYKHGDSSPFAVAMFDINDLKVINDKQGHESGDIYIKNSCKLICDIFKHSPVFRIGGDEFVVIVSNSDYPKRWELLQSLRDYIDMLAKSDLPDVSKVSIASGMSEYQAGDESLDDAFRRADEMMYKNKHIMKNGKVR